MTHTHLLIIAALAAGIVIGLRWDDITETATAVGGAVIYYAMLGWGMARHRTRGR